MAQIGPFCLSAYKSSEKGVETVREKMTRLMDCLISATEKISAKENADPEELAILPGLAISIVKLTGYAVVEPAEKKD